MLRIPLQLIESRILHTSPYVPAKKGTCQREGPIEGVCHIKGVFRLIGEGRSVRAIADALFLSPKTVETHKDHIKQKLGLKTSNDLLRYAIEARPG